MIESLSCCSPAKARRKGRHLIIRLLHVHFLFRGSRLSHRLRFYNWLFHYRRQFNYFRLGCSLCPRLGHHWFCHWFWHGLRLNCSIVRDSFGFGHSFRSCLGFGWFYRLWFGFFKVFVLYLFIFNNCFCDITIGGVIINV